MYMLARSVYVADAAAAAYHSWVLSGNLWHENENFTGETWSRECNVNLSMGFAVYAMQWYAEKNEEKFYKLIIIFLVNKLLNKYGDCFLFLHGGWFVWHLSRILTGTLEPGKTRAFPTERMLCLFCLWLAKTLVYVSLAHPRGIFLEPPEECDCWGSKMEQMFNVWNWWWPEMDRII